MDERVIAESARVAAVAVRVAEQGVSQPGFFGYEGLMTSKDHQDVAFDDVRAIAVMAGRLRHALETFVASVVVSDEKTRIAMNVALAALRGEEAMPCGCPCNRVCLAGGIDECKARLAVVAELGR